MTPWPIRNFFCKAECMFMLNIHKILYWSFLCFLHPVIVIWLWKYCFVGTTSPFKANLIIFIHGGTAAIWVVSLLFALVIPLFTLAWMPFRNHAFNRHPYSCCFIRFIFILRFLVLCTIKGQIFPSFLLFRTLSNCSSCLCCPGFLLFKDFCMNEIDEAVPQLKFYEEVKLCFLCKQASV